MWSKLVQSIVFLKWCSIMKIYHFQSSCLWFRPLEGCGPAFFPLSNLSMTKKSFREEKIFYKDQEWFPFIYSRIHSHEDIQAYLKENCNICTIADYQKQGKQRSAHRFECLVNISKKILKDFLRVLKFVDNKRSWMKNPIQTFYYNPIYLKRTFLTLFSDFV